MPEVPKLHVDYNPDEIIYFAETNYRNQHKKFGIKTDDRRRHMYIIGKTGMGKTNLMENMIIQDIQLGHGVAIVDPHGELASEILNYIPSERVNDIIYLNPADLEYPIAFNILENVNPDYKHLVASGLMGVFTKIWENMWSARMEYILNNCILALLDSPGTTLLGVNRLLVDKTYRKKIISNIKDPIVKTFWVDEYANYNERFRTEAIAPIQNKVGQFLSSSVIRNIVGQTKSSMDLRKVMDQGKILIMDLSKGRIGEDNSALLGAMMITKLQLAAMSRIDMLESERKDFYLYVDEFQNFATGSFATILSEARKYHLSLIMGHQYIEQLDENVRAAVFGNVGTLICFRVGAPDAEELVKEFTPYFSEEDLVNLTKFDIYLKLMIDGVASKPFSATTLPPDYKGEQTGNREKVINVSRERYAKSRDDVEDKIVRWSGIEEVSKALAASGEVLEEEAIYRADVVSKKGKRQTNISKDSKEKIKELEKEGKIPAVCDLCGQETWLNFEPDYAKNIFCRQCLKKIRKDQIDLPRKIPLRNKPPQKSEVPQPITVDSKKNQTIEVAAKEKKEVVKKDKGKVTQNSPEKEPPLVDFLASDQGKELLEKSNDLLIDQAVQTPSSISLTDLARQKPVSFRQSRKKDQSDTHRLRPGEVVKL